MQSKRAPKKLAGQELFEYAVKYLGFRACSTEELKGKLRLKAAAQTDVGDTIRRLKEIGYLNDERFAESFAANRMENDGFGKRRVMNDLRARRVSPKLAQETVERAFEGKDEPALIVNFIERRMPSIHGKGPIEDQRELARAFRRLVRAGFSPGASIKALRGLAARPEELSEPDEDEHEEEQ